MAVHSVQFDSLEKPVLVPTGSLISEAARLAGIEIGQPCGGQGRCGRCAVQVTSGTVRRRSALHLTAEDIEQGFALACQTVIEGDVSISVPQQEKIERRLATDRQVAEITPPIGYNPDLDQTMRRIVLRMPPPSLDDQTDDLSRLQTALRLQAGLTQVDVSLFTLRQMGAILRQADWDVTAVVEILGSPGSGMLQER
jgi:uncharacterized 2Fe-2S/4Fe-4S cluster protein (DUF4445 family)